MTDPETTQETPEQGPEQARASSPLVEELTQLGQNFSQLVKDALASPQLQEVQKEVVTGAQTVIDEINDAVAKARTAEVAQEVAQKAAKTAEELKTAPVTENLKSGLLNALKSVNQELTAVVQRMEQGQQQEEATAAPSSDETSKDAPD